jgi:hypothetical protein
MRVVRARAGEALDLLERDREAGLKASAYQDNIEVVVRDTSCHSVGEVEETSQGTVH